MRHKPAPAYIMAVSLMFAPISVAAEESFPDALAAGQNATRLEPVIPWNIDFGENRCRLTRIFGSAENRHLVMVEQAAPGGNFGLTLAGSELANFRTAGTVDLGLERDEPMTTRESFGKGLIPDLGPALIFGNVAIGTSQPAGPLRAVGIDLEEVATVDRVVLHRGKTVLSFETGNMKEPFAALNSCTDDLLVQWGLDPAAHRSHVPPKWTNESAVVQRIIAVYPSAARRTGEQAIFRMRVTVEADGSVSDCLMEESTVTKRLESPACKEMQRAVFDPARDAQGQPMRSFFATTVTYVING